LAAVGLRYMLFNGEAVAGLVGGGMRLAQEFAEVDEMRLRGGAFRERDGLPAFDKLGERERHRLPWVKSNFRRAGRGLGVQSRMPQGRWRAARPWLHARRRLREPFPARCTMLYAS